MKCKKILLIGLLSIFFTGIMIIKCPFEQNPEFFLWDVDNFLSNEALESIKSNMKNSFTSSFDFNNFLIETKKKFPFIKHIYAFYKNKKEISVSIKVCTPLALCNKDCILSRNGIFTNKSWYKELVWKEILSIDILPQIDNFCTKICCNWIKKNILLKTFIDYSIIFQDQTNILLNHKTNNYSILCNNQTRISPQLITYCEQIYKKQAQELTRKFHDKQWIIDARFNKCFVFYEMKGKKYEKKSIF